MRSARQARFSSPTKSTRTRPAEQAIRHPLMPGIRPGAAQAALQLQRTVGNHAINRTFNTLNQGDRLLRDGGRALSPPVRTMFESRLQHDLSGVRLHTDAEAAASARALGARAYTTGRDIAFGTGQYAPGTREGQRLLAHELTHVVQQSRPGAPRLQRSALRDFKDSDAMHDPSKLTDSEIEATEEFKSYMDSRLIWQWKHKVTREEARLACRLILREMRDGQVVIWSRNAGRFMNLARTQLGTLREATNLQGKLKHERASWTQFNDPTTAESHFIRWVLAGEPMPTDASKMNCWEMIFFAAFRGGFVSKARLEEIYRNAAQWTEDDPGNAIAPPLEIERQLCQPPTKTLNLSDPKAPEPLPGDVIIFDFIAQHAAISMGRTMIGGEHLVISLHQDDVQMTTIEALQRRPDLNKLPAKLCRARW
jgi:hypothetical protein